MASLDFNALEAVLEALCLPCTPHQPLSDMPCLSANCVWSCQGRVDEQLRIRALASLCQASKQVGALATRHLYHRPTTTHWPLLARTLLARPDLARRVRHLCARNYEYPETAVHEPTFPKEVARYWAGRVDFQDEAWLERVGRTAEAGDTGDPEQWQTGNIALDIVVSLCPALEELDAVLSFGPVFTLSPPGSLPALRTAAVAHNDTEGGHDVRSLGPLGLAAPGMQTLSGWQMGYCQSGDFRFEGVTHLRFYASGLDPTCLRHTLRACPRLEAFEYRASSIVGNIQFTAREAELALVELAPGLKALELNLDDVYTGEPAIGRDWVLGSLRGLKELRRLEVDTRCLVPHKDPHSTRYRRMPDGSLVPVVPTVPDVSDGALVELLPESIRELRIVRWDSGPPAEKLGAALARLAAAAGQFPALREVAVQDAWEGREAVGRAFGEKGVAFVSFDR